MRRFNIGLSTIGKVITLAGFCVLPSVQAEQVVFSEIMYHPRGAEPEYIEVYNNTSTPLDLAGWRVTDGVNFEFPRFDPANPSASFLKPFERIVLSSADPASVRATYGVSPSVRLFGPWEGNLANDGERVTLQDKNGVTLCTVQYNDRGKWSPAADGAGHSLVLKSPNRSVDDWRNWTVSTRPGGTPGTEPVLSAETPVTNPEVNLGSGITVLDYGNAWKYHDQNQDLGTAWRTSDYDDNAWPQGPGLFGFETAALPPPGIRTAFNNANQVAFYLRTKFVYHGPLAGAVLTVDQILDDGAVYYLNGQEIGRSGMAAGASGFTATANRTVSDAVEELNVFPVNASLLIDGTNTLAVEVHQSGPASTDVVFAMRLKVATPAQAQSGVVINEVLPGATGQGFIEFYNSQTAAVNLNGFYLTDDAANRTKFRLASNVTVPARGFASVGFQETGLTNSNPITVYLVAPDGSSIENGIVVTIPPDGRALGRKPAGGASWFLFTEPTRNAPNQSQSSLGALVRLNEIHFSSSNTVDWVELHNATNSALGLDGLFLAATRNFSDKVPLIGILDSGGFTSRNVFFPLDGDEVTIYLLNSADTVLDSRIFKRLPGRDTVQAYPDGGKEWFSSLTATRNAPNDVPRNSDIVINEIMYNPPSGQLDGEFIELFNRGASAVDLSGWRFTDGPNFIIPAGTSIPAGGYLVCAANAAWMRSVYGNIPVVGDFPARLADRGELIRLVDPFENLVDEVDYSFGGDWPELAHGSGSSLELANPGLDNGLGSAWRDSDETNKAPFRVYTVTDNYRQLNSLGAVTDYRELNLHLANDGYAVVRNISLRQNGSDPNLIVNGTTESSNGSGATGWLCQGTHAGSFLANGELHLIADGHGDNRANRAEIDVTAMAPGSVTLSFEARWVHGTPQLIAETWDHTLGAAFRLEIPNNLGTPGAANSTYRSAPPPQIAGLQHSPAVPKSTQDVKVTARVISISPIASVQLFHRADNINGNATWLSKPMFDDGVTSGDELAGDGIYTVTLTEHRVAGRIVQFYVRALGQNGESYLLPKPGPITPAMYVVDDRAIVRDLRIARFIISAYDVDAIANGGTAKYGYRFPRLSNHYKNMTFISNEEEVFYGGLLRNSGSPWTRSGSLERGKWKLPEDRKFRSHVKFTFDNDPAAGRMHHNRITRYMLYLLGHPVNENEFIRVVVNSGTPALREDTEPVAKDMMDRLFENGRQGELYRIDDEWWFRDDWQRNNRDADWSYKGTESTLRYHTEWMKRTAEDDYDYSALINLFRTVSATYTQPQIERLVDAEKTLLMAAVRGYIGDWDSFTLNRGKNGYTYRRWDDGKFMFMHWDSDLAFQNNTEVLFNGGRAGIGPYIAKPYNLRRFYYYLAELLNNYTQNSPRMNAWLQAEEDASTSFAVASSFYRGWFSSRLNYCRTQMGTNYLRPFEITTNGGQPITTAENTFTLSGLAPYTVFAVEIENQPDAVMTWTGLNSWVLSGIQLRSGATVLRLRGVDQWGNVIQENSITVTKTGNAPPVMALQADPDSWRVAVDQSLSIDARDSFDPEAGPLNFTWTLPPSLPWFDTNQTGLAIANFARPGLYPFSVQAIDTAGQSSAITREASVYGTDGFSSFTGARLEPFWNLGQVEYHNNSPAGSWVSLTDVPGSLVLRVLDTAALPLNEAAPRYPVITRRLPAVGDWVLQTKLDLASRQFGSYLAGLLVEAVEAGATNRYVFGVENGNLLSVKRATAAGEVSSVASLAMNLEEVVLRVRRSGANLYFDQSTNGVWTTVASQAISPSATAGAGGLFLSTSAAQSIGVHFDYALLIDPSNTSQLRDNLRISELMYHPVGGEEFEFIELINSGTAPLDLAGCRFVDGIDFTFGPGMLAPQERVVIVSQLSAFASRYPNNAIRVAGAYSGRLANNGESITLLDAQGNIVTSFSYGTSGDWPGRADGLGSSLEIVNPRGDYSDPANWNSSAEYQGSPGASGAGKLASVVVNEVLSHADQQLEDAIELYNPTASAIDISGWYLSDDEDALKKFRIPAGTVIPANGYQVLFEQQFGDTNNPAIIPFAFDSAAGDDVWLTAADAAGNLTYFIDHVDFGPGANGVSFGRFPNGGGSSLIPLSQRTFGVDNPVSLEQFRTSPGAANAYPKVGPVIFTRILYHPRDTDDEFLELANITQTNVSLFDPVVLTNAWKIANAVQYGFPSNITLEPGERVLVVPIDPGIFRAKYGLPAELRIFGPYAGSLDNSGERLELYQPDPPQAPGTPNAGLVPYVLVESIRYDEQAPWPALADEFGLALMRHGFTRYADDPSNWFTDYDRDGMADDWELAYGLYPFDASDATLDLDGDGFVNLQEYERRTNPRLADNVIEILSPRHSGDTFMFEFSAAPNQSYSVLYSTDLNGGTWQRLMNIPREPTGRVVPVVDSLLNAGSIRFYRVVSPQQE